MIPVTLTLKGVYSYKEKQSIDFRELTSDHLFGIFGTVGSGKSSILEAITFALYGKIERLNSKGLKYNMMNLSSNEMFIDFTFQANNGNFYNSVSHFKRNSKKHGDINTGSRSCYRVEEHDFESKTPITTDELEQVIGLTYENFKRTIIIPQGKFQEFLKLGAKDRSSMLEEIFDLEKFNLFYKTQSLINKSLTRRSEIEGALATLGALNPEEPKLLVDQIETISQSIALKTEEKSRLEVQKNILDQLKKDIEEIESTTEKLKTAEADRPMVEQKRNQLAQFRTFISVFKPLLDQQNGIKIQIDQQNEALLKKKAERNTTAERLQLVQNQLDELIPEYENRQVLLEKSLDVENIFEIRKNQENIVLLTKKSEQSLRDIATKAAWIEEKTDQVRQFEIQLETLKESLPDSNRLNEAKNWHLIREKIVKDGVEKSGRVKLMQEENQKLESEISTLISGAEIQNSEDFSSVLTAIASKIADQKRQLQLIDEETSELKLAQQLSQYANSLHEGKPCPLCGALEHPNIHKHEDVAQLLAEKQKLQKTASDAIETLQKIDAQLKGKQEHKEALKARIDLAQSELNVQRDEFRQHENSFAFEPYPKDLAWVEAGIEKHKTDSKAIEDKEKVLKSLRATIEATNNERSLLEQETNRSALQKTEFTTIVKQRTEALKHLNPNDFQDKSEADLKKIGAEFSLLHQVIEKQFGQFTQEISDLKIQQSGIEGILQELDHQLKNLTAQNAAIEKRLKSEELKYPEINAELIARFSETPMDIEIEEQAVKQFDEQIIALTTALKTLKAKSEKLNYDALLHQQTMEQITSLTGQILEATERKGQLDKQLEILNKQLADHQQFIEELDKLNSRIGDLNKISGMFKGNGFVNYVSTYYLDNLCKEANKRFVKLSNGLLELTLSSDNSFDVIDHLNNGYIRSSDSLSGGQTFQASLCLALALSDAINRKSNIRQNFFFMDEGFGSLDNQSLHTVFQTLQALRMENRIVGLISHVDEMKQEIPKCLVITNTDDRGSRIGFSWR
jgi:exonuclease SbcC